MTGIITCFFFLFFLSLSLLSFSIFSHPHHSHLLINQSTARSSFFCSLFFLSFSFFSSSFFFISHRKRRKMEKNLNGMERMSPDHFICLIFLKRTKEGSRSTKNEKALSSFFLSLEIFFQSFSTFRSREREEEEEEALQLILSLIASTC